jgi:hypothetical protein
VLSFPRFLKILHVDARLCKTHEQEITVVYGVGYNPENLPSRTGITGASSRASNGCYPRSQIKSPSSKALIWERCLEGFRRMRLEAVF